MEKPALKPQNPCFSSGPCAKRPGWTPAALAAALTGRSHRSGPGKNRLKETIELQRTILGIPADYKIAIVPASDTGAIEMALWSLLGPRGVDVLAWENFGQEWLKDVTKQLKLPDVRTFSVDYGDLPDLSKVDTDRDVVFTWNGTTSGVCVPHADWIKADRQGLTFCDATSAVFAYDLPWEKLDVITWSWQKVLGGEAAHGVIVLSPRAVARLESYTPPWPLPKIFIMTKGKTLNEDLFEGATINTPSMLVVEDCLDALRWVQSLGGLTGLQKRIDANIAVLEAWVAKAPWIEFLRAERASRSNTSVCLKITDPWFLGLENDARWAVIKSMTKMLETEKAAYDIAGHAAGPAGLRLWCGGTVEATDLKAATAWIDWAWESAKAAAQKQAA